ncbi:hypothetical protein ELQ90_03885 [Labedella phragmitis]|uniref:Uncharacterized protein n=1 Tax=Labedella phragmitis TaxID=2498849 RepID=A0A444PYV9_9MICO|nr:hypothetical protein [Labedella phragmitis]RWZ53074.1 hypothetical protein ELQ90_03885 [Labedella phragmitis]
MSERGNTTHSARLDEELKHETQSIVQGHGPSHVEEFRQTEPLPDDTDDAEVLEASGVDGGFIDADDPIVHRSPAGADDVDTDVVDEAEEER